MSSTKPLTINCTINSGNDYIDISEPTTRLISATNMNLSPLQWYKKGDLPLQPYLRNQEAHERVGRHQTLGSNENG